MSEEDGKKGVLSEIVDDIRHHVVEEAWFGQQTTGDISSSHALSPQEIHERDMAELDGIQDHLAASPETEPYADSFREAAQDIYDSMEPGEQTSEGYSFSTTDMEQNLPSEADLGLDQEMSNDLER
jgi:hypothetical protein